MGTLGLPRTNILQKLWYYLRHAIIIRQYRHIWVRCAVIGVSYLLVLLCLIFVLEMYVMQHTNNKLVLSWLFSVNRLIQASNLVVAVSTHVPAANGDRPSRGTVLIAKIRVFPTTFVWWWWFLVAFCWLDYDIPHCRSGACFTNMD